MDTLSLNPGRLSLERLTLNLRQDERGYYWQTEIGENTDARFSNPHDAIADLITLWSGGCHTPRLDGRSVSSPSALSAGG